MTELWALSAADQARLIRTRAASAREVAAAGLARRTALWRDWQVFLSA